MDIQTLYLIIQNRLGSKSANSYTWNLSKQGLPRVAQKLGEEATELIIEAVKGKNDKRRIVEEAADVFFHYLVLLASAGVTPKDVFDELQSRHKD